jgi:hypothetical protein
MAKTTGLLLGGSLKTAGVTFYQKNGQMIARSARSVERRSNTRGQFVQRQRMRHTTALWQRLKSYQPMFVGGKSVYARFATLANRLTPVFVPCKGPLWSASFLMPNIPVSDGNLPHIKQWLGEVDGTATLLTNLQASDLQADEVLRFYTACQRMDGQTPRVYFQPVRELSLDEFVTVDGCLALKGDDFADEMKGWALVRVEGDRCSSQGLVTRCRVYEPYTTEEALMEAAESYGGLTEGPLPDAD